MNKIIVVEKDETQQDAKSVERLKTTAILVLTYMEYVDTAIREAAIRFQQEHEDEPNLPMVLARLVDARDSLMGAARTLSSPGILACVMGKVTRDGVDFLDIKPLAGPQVEITSTPGKPTPGGN